MASDSYLPEDDRLIRVGRASALVAVSTLALTASFIGVLAILEGQTAGIRGRHPWYLVVGCATFVTMVIFLEGHSNSGKAILTTAGIVTVLSYVSITLTVEGLVYMIRFPETVFVSQLMLYFVAAGLLATGIGFWALHHWREFTSDAL